MNARLSQQFVANALGVSRQAVASWENGRTEPSLDTIQKLAALYDVDANWLAFGPGSTQASMDQEILRIAAKAQAMTMLKEKAEYWENELRKLIERAKADLEAGIPSEAKQALERLGGAKRRQAITNQDEGEDDQSPIEKDDPTE